VDEDGEDRADDASGRPGPPERISRGCADEHAGDQARCFVGFTLRRYRPPTSGRVPATRPALAL
jgi:hypothetical protein